MNRIREQQSEMWNSDDPTTRARARGRTITAALAFKLGPDGYGGEEQKRRIASGDRDAWAWSIDPSGGYVEPIKVTR